ncbi:MAG TPA: cysteine desulfurase family protein [Dehalococcoidia bacterium]|nr:cysteine desulfurase family protein [Dehalococcoidia bacterium]
MPEFIYLDHAALSPVNPRVAAAMAPWQVERFGNPSALYRAGREAAAAIEAAREAVGVALNCRPAELVFTSGGSESVNAALKGIAFAQQFARLGAHVVVSAVEHHAVLHTCQYLERFGFETEFVRVDGAGRVDPDAVAAAVREDTVLVSVMLANNETGTVQPLVAIAGALRARAARLGREIPLHTDAVQAPRWLPVDVETLGVDALSLSAHKLGGPTGAGALYLRRGVPFLAQQTGGGQERQRRAGTEHVAGIVGLGAAIKLAEAERAENVRRVQGLSERLIAGVRERLPAAILNGSDAERLPNVVNFTFPGAEGEQLVLELDERGVAASSGAACASVSWEPSHVLLAMGLPIEHATAAVRFSLGPETTAPEIDRVIAILPEAVAAASGLAVS